MPSPDARIRTRTATLYGDLWGRLGAAEYEEAITENERFYTIPDTDVRGKVCVDVGCGSGFFVTRLFRTGAAEVHALDISRDCQQTTRKWNAPFADHLHVHDAGFPTLPLPDALADFAHSNGVLHHTENPEAGFRDLVRVTKPGGLTVIGMYGAGGLFPFTLNLLRGLARHIPYRITSWFIGLLYPDPYNQYRALDYLYVPIQQRYRESELRAWYEACGCTDIQRLRTHARYHRGLWSRFIHGEGYLFMSGRKPSPTMT